MTATCTKCGAVFSEKPDPPGSNMVLCTPTCSCDCYKDFCFKVS